MYKLLFESGLTAKQMIVLRASSPSFYRTYASDYFWDRIYALKFAPNEYNWDQLKERMADRLFIILALNLRQKLREHSMFLYLGERQNMVEFSCSVNNVITINYVAQNGFKFNFLPYGLITISALFTPDTRLTTPLTQFQVISFLYRLFFNGWKPVYQRLLESRVPEY